MKALRIDRTGSLDALELRDVSEPPLASGDVRVRVEAAGVNPSDVGIVLGRFPHLVLPRTLGRDFAGEIVEGPAHLIGTKVWGTGGGELGLTRDGAHAGSLTIPAGAVATRPPHLAAESAAAMGTPYLTAWSALVDLAQLRAGESVVITGASGSVGTAAVQIVNALGAGAIPIDRDGVEGLVETVLDATGGRGADVALNAIGAPAFSPLVDALAKGGRMVIFSALAGKDVQLDLFVFYRKRLSFFGLDSAAFSLERVADVLTRLSPYVESKALAAPSVSERYPLTRAPEAYARVQAGGSGKVVLLP
jgi:NADPH:quinone reductase-like Zn-dependent oxidoreductase